ncbi:hypothetical protein ACWEKT_22130 [Nocardia takedensis]
MTAPTAARPASVAELTEWTAAGTLGLDPSTVRASSAFLTVYGTRHAGRAHGYRNEVLSVRVGAAVGSCGIERDAPGDHLRAVDDCPGATVADLLVHPLPAVRIAALDAYLLHAHPHPRAGGRRAEPVTVAGTDTLEKSRRRAAAVVDLLPVGPGAVVLVIGVVNSLLAALRARGIDYLPCDRVGGHTEWGEPVATSAADGLEMCDALLVTGMTLGNGSFDTLRAAAARRAVPLTLFAQTGSAVLPWFLGTGGVHAVSAEPYPFFSLDGAPSTLFHYRDGGAA